jgi:hypothetical protein
VCGVCCSVHVLCVAGRWSLVCVRRGQELLVEKVLLCLTM